MIHNNQSLLYVSYSWNFRRRPRAVLLVQSIAKVDRFNTQRHRSFLMVPYPVQMRRRRENSPKRLPDLNEGSLVRAQIIKPINDLATKVQSWSKAEDKKVLRLIEYIDATKHYLRIGYINGEPANLYLSLLQTADFAGEKEGARSTSGGYLVLKGPKSHFPWAWLSKRQTSTPRPHQGIRSH